MKDSIASPALKLIAAHWFEAGCGRIPRWKDINPAAIAGQLPIIWSYRYDRSNGTFTGRLAGDQIIRILGKDFRGLPLAEAQPPEAFPWVYALCKRVVVEPAIYRSEGRVFKQRDRYGQGERIIFPLSDDGVHCDGIFGATQYRTNPEDRSVSVEAVSEWEQWFPISAAANSL